jgi:hypothetical protein
MTHLKVCDDSAPDDEGMHITGHRIASVMSPTDPLELLDGTPSKTRKTPLQVAFEAVEQREASVLLGCDPYKGSAV